MPKATKSSNSIDLHNGYCINKNYRGKGYATKGLALAIEKAKQVIKEGEIYFSVHIDNAAYIHHSDEKEHYTRIKI